MASDLIRSITCYDQSDELVFEIELPNFNISKLSSLWVVGEDTEMVNSYEISILQLPDIKNLIPEFVNIAWNTSKYSYFLECSQKATHY